MESYKRGNGVMKKLILRALLLLIGSGTIAHTMENPNALKISQSRYNAFDKIKTDKTLPLTEQQLLDLIKRGDYDALQQELARGLNAKYIFENGEFKGESLIQVAFGKSVVNRNDIAARLLKHGAQPEDLNEFIKTAVKAFSAETVQWLLNHGAKDESAYAIVAMIEPKAQGYKKEQLIKIKELLAPKKAIPSSQIIPPKAAELRNTELPVVVVSQPVKKQPEDLYTVLGQPEEQKLFKAVLSGDEKTLTEYLDMGVSPNFVFSAGSAGKNKSLLQLAITEGLKNQEKIADILLQYGADSNELNKGLLLAVERMDAPKVAWLVAKGAQPTNEILNRVKDLEKNNTHPVKQKKLLEIKTLLENKKQVVPGPVIPRKPLPPVPQKSVGKNLVNK